MNCKLFVFGIHDIMPAPTCSGDQAETEIPYCDKSCSRVPGWPWIHLAVG